MKPARGMSAAVELGDEALAAGARAAHRRAGHEDGELVGAGAPDHVGRAREAAQALGDGEQGGVAGGGAAAGVERAEVVDVDERQRGRLLGAARRGARTASASPQKASSVSSPVQASVRARSASWASRPASRARASASARRSS